MKKVSKVKKPKKLSIKKQLEERGKQVAALTAELGLIDEALGNTSMFLIFQPKFSRADQIKSLKADFNMAVSVGKNRDKQIESLMRLAQIHSGHFEPKPERIVEERGLAPEGQ